MLMGNGYKVTKIFGNSKIFFFDAAREVKRKSAVIGYNPNEKYACMPLV